MSDLWGEEENFNDMPEEVSGQDAAVPKVAQGQRATRPAPPPQPELEEILEEVGEDYADVFNDANLRIEQGRLYQMIMNHSLFADLDADPRAIANVEREIKQFARESMEVMLGMRQTIGRPHDPTAPANLPQFNSLEVQILKMIASKASGGKTESDNVDEIARQIDPRQPAPAPVAPLKRTALNTIGSPKKTVAPPPAPKPQPRQQPKAPAARLPEKPAAPVKRTKLDATIERVAAEEGIPKELLAEEVIGKPVAEMTETELFDHNKKISKRRGRQVKASNGLPMATPEQMETLAHQQAALALKAPGLTNILTHVANATKKT